MSLFIIGSCSKITQNIVHQLAKTSQYSKITIGDLLPCYSFHHRYYKLRQQLTAAKRTNITVSIEKLIQPEDIYQGINSHDDVLFVTHDYFNAVTSKTKLMELTAQFGNKKNNLLFATPLEYDHFGFERPEENYLKAQEKVTEIFPKASFIRSDIQDKNELYAYINKKKNLIEDKLLTVPASFTPKVVSSAYYASVVAKHLSEKKPGVNLLVQGQKQLSVSEVPFDQDLTNCEIDHTSHNVRYLVKKYKGLNSNNVEVVVGKV